MKDRKISFREVEVGDYLNAAIEPYGFSLDRSECVEAMKQFYKAND